MDKKQDFSNHARYFPFHHFILAPLSLAFFIWTLVDLDFSSSEEISESVKSLILAIMVLSLPMLARIYALKKPKSDHFCGNESSLCRTYRQGFSRKRGKT